MKKILLPILSLILAACSSSQTAVTRSAQVTVTSLPPTATPIPTPTLHPQFVALQTQVAASGERFTLAPDGTIQDGAIIVPGLSVDKNGAITLRGDSSQVTISPEDVSFDDENGVSVKGYTLDEATGLWGVEVVKEYPICAPENFRDCKISVEDLFNGNYLRWLEKTFPNLFDPKKVIDVPMDVFSEEWISYNEATAPNFENVDPESWPFRADVTAAMVEAEVDGVKFPYRVRPSAFYNPDTQGAEWVILVDSYYFPSDPFTDEEIDEDIAMWRKNMNFSPIVTNARAPLTNSDEDPLVAKTFANFPDMEQRLADFAAGDRTALSQPGIVLKTYIFWPGTPDMENFR